MFLSITTLLGCVVCLNVLLYKVLFSSQPSRSPLAGANMLSRDDEIPPSGLGWFYIHWKHWKCHTTLLECSYWVLLSSKTVQQSAQLVGWNDSHLNCKAANTNCTPSVHIWFRRDLNTNYLSQWWQCIYDDSIHLVIMGGILFIAIMFLFRAKYFLFLDRKNIWDPSLSMWRLCWQ